MNRWRSAVEGFKHWEPRFVEPPGQNVQPYLRNLLDYLFSVLLSDLKQADMVHKRVFFRRYTKVWRYAEVEGTRWSKLSQRAVTLACLA